MILFAKRSKAAKTPIAVAITGTGHKSRCYATINGTKYTSATTGIEVMSGDVIIFGVYGLKPTHPGIVRIDGTDVLTVTNKLASTYDWNVPDGIASVSIKLSYDPYWGTGNITVTTA